MTDSKLFDINTETPLTWKKSTPITAESIRRGAEAMLLAWQKQHEGPPPQRTLYESRANIEALAADLEADPEFAKCVRITRGADGLVTSIEW